MIDVRPFVALGYHRLDWLESRFHFSFAEYYDPDRMGFGPLRVWNDDVIQPGKGFPPHPHRDMEIITYVRHGAISHEDSLGNKGRTEAGDVQVMWAGTGIVHAEFNLEDTDPTTLFQIWIEPAELGIAPGWADRKFPAGTGAGALTVLASGRSGDAGDTGALPIHQDAALLCATLEAGESVTHILNEGRRAYLVPAHGNITVNGVPVAERDGVAISDEDRIVIDPKSACEIVLLDLP
jgi:redox-sensitive bicupin YhaK (pirin superfamily)